jgi:hypothetical protein
MTEVRTRAYKPVRVEINDSWFESVDLTESDSEKFDKAMEVIAKLEYDAEHQEDPEKLSFEDRAALIERVADEIRAFRLKVLDLMLQPIEGGRQKASTVIKAGLKSGELTPRQLDALWDDIPAAIGVANGQDAEGDLTRPT